MIPDSMNCRCPHILILTADELRADFTPMEPERHPYVLMPRIAELAENGTYFRNAYTPAPICVPARQALLAGQFPRHCGCRDWGQDIAPDVVTYPQWFAAHGYTTVAAGKMHLQGPDQMKGWQHRIGYDQVGPALSIAGFEKMTDVAKQRRVPGTGKWAWKDEVKKARYGEGYWNRHDRYAVKGTEIFLDQYFAGQDYDRIGAAPLLLQVSLLMPHFPFICDEEWFTYYLPRVRPYIEQAADDHPCHFQQYLRVGDDVTEREVQRATAAYCGMCSQVDALFGRVIDHLKHLGVYDDFVIIFHSDHGDMLGEHGAWQKFIFFEGAVRIPLLISAPGKRWARRVVEQNVNQLALFPTLCDLAEIPEPPESDADSLMPLVRGEIEEDINAEVFSELYCYAVMREDTSHTWGHGHQLMIKRGPLKFVTYEMKDWPDQLFDLGHDPRERHNLANDPRYAGAVSEFRERAAAFRAVERRPPFPVKEGRWSYVRR